MRDVNWWLMTLSFLIGLVLTLGLMVRRVTREVPITHAVSAGVSAAAAAASTLTGGAAALVASIEDVGAGPFGKGSAKPNADGSGPAGWTVKGNVDSMLYHPTDSPAYSQTIAEVWFFDEETARAAGFDKWDKNLR